MHLSDEVRARKVFKGFLVIFFDSLLLVSFEKRHVPECVVVLNYAMAEQQLSDEKLKSVFFPT